jgi:chloramphenicol 3-O phosphotransferase
MTRVLAPVSGKIILLNGASSAGKSTLARAIQAKINVPFWHVSVDQLMDTDVLPRARFRTGEFKWAASRTAFFEGFYRSLPAYAEAGNNLIVSHIIETDADMRTLARVLASFDVYFVGVHCDIVEMERREALRGDRPQGDARRDLATVHLNRTYDLEVDTIGLLDHVVDQVLTGWQGRNRPSVFEVWRNRADDDVVGEECGRPAQLEPV